MYPYSLLIYIVRLNAQYSYKFSHSPPHNLNKHGDKRLFIIYILWEIGGRNIIITSAAVYFSVLRGQGDHQRRAAFIFKLIKQLWSINMSLKCKKIKIIGR